MKSVRASVLVSLSERYVMLGLSLITMVFIARLLRPEEIGLYSVAAAFVGLAHVVRDFGVGSYLIQEPELTSERIRTAFGVALAAGLILFVGLFVTAGPIATFYRDERLVELLRLLSVNFLIIPFGATALSLLRREMAFGPLFIINVAAASGSAAVALLLAWRGAGAMSMAWASVISSALTAAVSVLWGRRGSWLVPGMREWRRVVSFGSQSTMASVITEIAMNFNDLVVARAMGFAPAAMLSRAQGVMSFFHHDAMSAVRNVALPAFAIVHRERSGLAAAHAYAVALVTSVAWPFYGLMSLFPLEFLRLLFGPQWDAAAPLVPVFCLAGGVAALWSLIPSVFIATGRIDLTLKTEISISVARIVLLACVVLWLRSLKAYAVMFLAVYILVLVVFYRVLQHVLHGNPFPSSKMLGQSAAVSAITLAVPLLVRILFPAPISVTGLLLVCTWSALAWIAALMLVRHPLARHFPWASQLSVSKK